jgi:hypothetical protein
MSTIHALPWSKELAFQKRASERALSFVFLDMNSIMGKNQYLLQMLAPN